MIIYAFEWNDCIYESGFSIVSLHTTKKGAFKAMTACVNQRWQDARDMDLMWGSTFGYSPLRLNRWRINEYVVKEN